MSEADEVSRPGKRRRIARACDQCRHGKLKCDGLVPRCSKCLETKKACSYGAAAKRRGLKTGYVRALECLWGLVIQNIPDSEAAVVSLLSGASILDFRIRDQLGDSTSNAEGLLASWKASKIAEKTHQLLAITEDSGDESSACPTASTRNVQEHRPVDSWSSYVQRADERTSRALSFAPDHVDNDGAPNSQTDWSGPAIQALVADQDGSTLCQPTSHAPRLPAEARLLLDWYLSYHHLWLPIVERHVVFRTLYSYPTEGPIITRQSPDSGDHAVLWAILACASTEAAQTANTPAKYAKEPQASESMYTHARNLIPWENEHQYSLGHVQAMTILALYRWTVHEYKAAWMLITQAISIACAIDLDQLSTAWQTHKCAAERVWLGCFVMESLLAMRLRKVPYLGSEDVESCLPIDESGLEEWEPWRSSFLHANTSRHQNADPNLPSRTLSTFNQLIRLISVANSLLRVPAGTLRGPQIALLEAWKEGVPKHCSHLGLRSDRDGPSLTLSPSIVNIAFVYLWLEIQLYTYPTVSVEESHIIRNYVDLISQVCKLGGSQMLPPTLEILACAAANVRDILPGQQEETLRQLHLDLISLGLAGNGPGLQAAENNSAVDSLRDNPWVQGPPETADGQGVESFFPQENTMTAGTRANTVSFPKPRQREDTLNTTDITYRSLFSMPGGPEGSYQFNLQPDSVPQAGIGDNNISLGPMQQDGVAFLSADSFPTMTTGGDPFLDYFEMFEDPETQDRARFNRALGYTI